MSIERRSWQTEFRDVPGSDGRQKWATAVTYNRVDDYGTIWLPGVFDESLAERAPVVLYGHRWDSIDNVLGRGIDWRQTPDGDGPPGVDVLMEFDADIPAGALALKLVDKRILSDVSVGFERREWVRRDGLNDDQRAAGATEAMIRAGMDELSLVVRGAVPGATIRSRRGAVDLDAVVEIARRKAAGELSDTEAQAALDLLAGLAPADTPTPAPGPVTPEPAVEAVEVDLGELDAALESIGRAVRR